MMRANTPTTPMTAPKRMTRPAITGTLGASSLAKKARIIASKTPAIIRSSATVKSHAATWRNVSAICIRSGFRPDGVNPGGRPSGRDQGETAPAVPGGTPAAAPGGIPTGVGGRCANRFFNVTSGGFGTGSAAGAGGAGGTTGDGRVAGDGEPVTPCGAG